MITQEKLPVTVLSDFFEDRKRPLLNHVVHNKDGIRVAVTVNDMSNIDVDGQLVKNTGMLVNTEEKLVEMSNGCICCTIHEDLLKEVRRLANENRFDYLMTESTGMSEPLPVAQNFCCQDEANGIDFSPAFTLDTPAAIVDCFNFIKDFSPLDTLRHRKVSDWENDHRTILNLLTDQIEFANVIVPNKKDMVTPGPLGSVKAMIQKLNSYTVVTTSEKGRVDLKQIPDTGLLDSEKTSQPDSRIEERVTQYTPETEEYGMIYGQWENCLCIAATLKAMFRGTVFKVRFTV